MLQAFFHAWERRLASSTTDRVVRPFEWGLEWVPQNGHRSDATPADVLGDWVSHVMADTDAFFTPPTTSDYTLRGDELTFPSALDTPHPANNVVHARWFPSTSHQSPATSHQSPATSHRRRAAVVVLPQWNADPGGHIGLCKLLAWTGISALRLSLPYHDKRMPPELHRADYIVSSNVARTVQICRQAVSMRGAQSPGSPPRATTALASWAPASDRASRC